jgi:hypothetical protein
LSLARIERAFGTLNGVDMQVRPVFHWREHCVKAHVFLCMPQRRSSRAPLTLSLLRQTDAHKPSTPESVTRYD